MMLVATRDDKVQVPVVLGAAKVATYRDYPSNALAAGVEARVTVKIMIDKGGRFAGCVGDSKLADPILAEKFERQTCRLVRERAAFRAGRDETGAAIGGHRSLSFVWQIEANPRHVVDAYASRMRLVLDAAGLPVGCHYTTTLPHVDAEQQCRQTMGSISRETLNKVAGTAVGSVRELRVAFDGVAMPATTMPGTPGRSGRVRAAFTLMRNEGVVDCSIEEQANGPDPCEVVYAELERADPAQVGGVLRQGVLEASFWIEDK